MSFNHESPIEEYLSEALVFAGFQVENQVQIGPYRVDMIVSSRINQRQIIVECDGRDYHHFLIDDFRADHLTKLSGLTVCHISGSHIVKSPYECVLAIATKFFPEHLDTVGCMQCVEAIEGSKMHLLPPSADRAMLRSVTPSGFARAFFLANP